MVSTDSACSYNEALPFMLSIPLYTICETRRVLVDDRPRLGTFIHIRNLTIGQCFYTPEQSMRYGTCLIPIWPYRSTKWSEICNTLASMTSLRYLCIFIMQKNVIEYFQTHSEHENVNFVAEFLKPLKSIRIPEGGVFDVVAQGWTIPEGAVGDAPFKVIQERPPSVADLQSRTHELGEFSQGSYMKLASMPWPLRTKPLSP